jgi:7,8-dihydro-6-hydroxymethylpterin-pyrophosphokinase
MQFPAPSRQLLGRQPSIRWGPCLIDIDILFFGADNFAKIKFAA